MLNIETPDTFDYSIRFSISTHQRSTFDWAIAGLLSAFLGFPITGEVFDDPAIYKARLQGFSLSQGFAVVIGKSNKNAFIEFLYIHYSAKTRNNRQLEDQIERNLKDKIVSRRKRSNTQVMQKLDCRWRYIYFFKATFNSAVEKM